MRRINSKRQEINLTGRLSSYLVGQRFGKLIAAKVAERRNDKLYWLCNCDCGRQRVVWSADLKKGRVTHCGYCPQ